MLYNSDKRLTLDPYTLSIILSFLFIIVVLFLVLSFSQFFKVVSHSIKHASFWCV